MVDRDDAFVCEDKRFEASLLEYTLGGHDLSEVLILMPHETDARATTDRVDEEDAFAVQESFVARFAIISAIGAGNSRTMGSWVCGTTAGSAVLGARRQEGLRRSTQGARWSRNPHRAARWAGLA